MQKQKKTVVQAEARPQPPALEGMAAPSGQLWRAQPCPRLLPGKAQAQLLMAPNKLPMCGMILGHLSRTPTLLLALQRVRDVESMDRNHLCQSCLWWHFGLGLGLSPCTMTT